jgi:hypothetical protein
VSVALSIFELVATVVQIAGFGFGLGLGLASTLAFAVGGVIEAVTTVEADAVLLLPFVSDVSVVTMTVFVFVPVSETVALIVIATDPPDARLAMEQSSARRVVEHVPATADAETNVTPTGAESATLTFWATPGPMLETTMSYLIGTAPPPSGSRADAVAAFVTVISAGVTVLGGVVGVGFGVGLGFEQDTMIRADPTCLSFPVFVSPAAEVIALTLDSEHTLPSEGAVPVTVTDFVPPFFETARPLHDRFTPPVTAHPCTAGLTVHTTPAGNVSEIVATDVSAVPEFDTVNV